MKFCTGKYVITRFCMRRYVIPEFCIRGYVIMKFNIIVPYNLTRSMFVRMRWALDAM